MGRRAPVNDLDRRLLQMIQRDFPVVARPYAVLGRRLGCGERTAFDRIRRMRRSGLIRRIGGNFDSRRLGFASTLVAMEVPAERLQQVAAVVSRCPEVTHNYERDGSLNLWFTVIAPSRAALRRLGRELRRTTSPRRMLFLDARRVFKIDARFAPPRGAR